MSVTKGARYKRNEKIQDVVQHHSTMKNPVVFRNVSKPSPVLSDRSEFPSLNESSEKELSKSHSGKMLKYSDKLKPKPISNNQGIMDDDFHSENVAASGTLSHNDRIHAPKVSDDKSNFYVKGKCQNFNQDNFEKPRFVNTKKMHASPSKSITKSLLNQSTKECSSLNQQMAHIHQKELPKENHGEISNNVSCASHKLPNSATSNLNSSSTNQTKCSKSVKLIEKKNELKEGSADKEKKKKKRKSKIKRQVALQSGKITVLTPEVHLKILGLTNAITSSNSKSILIDINDEEEYPELGKPLLQTNQKLSSSKKDVLLEPATETTDQPSESYTENKIPDTADKESPLCDVSEKPVLEKKGKCDNKATVHPKDPITISFCDMILNKNIKSKDVEEEIYIPASIGLKAKVKKDVVRPHNLLDSSPVVKRGKEREKPKLKRPSQLKKIILFDRKTRREQLLNLKANNLGGNDAVGVELVNELNTEELNDKVDVVKSNFPDEDNSNASDSSDASSNQEEKTAEQMPTVLINKEDNLQSECVPKKSQFSLSENHLVEEEDLPCANAVNQGTNTRDYLDGSVSPLNEMYTSENISSVISSDVTETVSQSNVSYSPDSLLNSLMSNVKKSETSDKEKAAKILLHTRNFREYCNHLISKDIDDAVFSLLDDLARFQDRLHQKDPVKARMKKRMINGIKEVKKHIKLRKLKCIIIAVDIENVEAQGGLNDILNDIKVSAAEHHIPCVFALSRKLLGKVCRKPVPISCVGVLNFEGSEVNFKKMVALQTQSKADYNEIFSKLTLKLTDEEASALLKAKAEAPETLRVIRTDILNDFFMKSKTGATENENKSDQISGFINTENN